MFKQLKRLLMLFKRLGKKHQIGQMCLGDVLLKLPNDTIVAYASNAEDENETCEVHQFLMPLDLTLTGLQLFTNEPVVTIDTTVRQVDAYTIEMTEGPYDGATLTFLRPLKV